MCKPGLFGVMVATRLQAKRDRPAATILSVYKQGEKSACGIRACVE